MISRKFYWLSTASLIALVVLAVIGEFFSSANLLFNTLLTVSGVIAGYLINHYFAKAAEQHNLGEYASAGYRLSVNIYDSLSMVMKCIKELEDGLKTEQTTSTKEVRLMLDNISNQLEVLQLFALSANDQWRSVLPPMQLEDLKKRENIVELSDKRALKITTDTHVIHER